ncbi:MAG: DUF169 domain-containing protein [Acidobacteriota bacterium]|nr:DUF169 domain-containing protein [Acidobacteriota bacterium]
MTDTQTDTRKPWHSTSDRLVAALQPFAPPVAISFHAPGALIASARRDVAFPEPNEHGRTGQVPAGCVFWMHGVTATFATSAADHANCSVGSYTHGFLTLEEAATKDDVGAVLESGWVDETAVTALPVVTERPGSIVYGPLADAETRPDVVLLRVNSIGLMTLKDAVPDMHIEGKPQCHVVAIAKEQNAVAASVGCALSRARTGMGPEEVTCVIPGAQLEEITTALESTVALNRTMANYAAMDARRFRTQETAQG